MSSNSPDWLVPLALQPLMAQSLRIKVMDLKGAVVHVRGWVRAHEKRVVVDELGTAVDVCE